MARPRKETDLKVLAKERYEQLSAKKNMIDWELRAIEAYLKSLGGVRAGRRERAEKVSERPMKPPEKGKKPRKRTATKKILSLIGRSAQGISIDQIMKKTRLGRQTVHGVLNRLKKERKVKAAQRGVYAKA